MPMYKGSTHEFSKPIPLRAGKVKYIVIHHSASKWGTSKDIHQWHLERGWSGIGYHFVIPNLYPTYDEWFFERPKTGQSSIEIGRPEQYLGAHVKGMNDNSIGICIIGNYDEDHLPYNLWEKAVRLAATLCIKYELDESSVIGHRECYALLDQLIQKECPGKKVSMDQFRKAVGLLLRNTEKEPEMPQNTQKSEWELPKEKPSPGSDGQFDTPIEPRWLLFVQCLFNFILGRGWKPNE
jgi:N-acetyl-anhydromuramyl-L-alanine amidase AmpD